MLGEAVSGRSKRRKVARESALNGGQQDAKGTALYHCDYCRRDISRTVRIKCAVCQNFDLCLNCFSVGVEITPHKSDHAYRVVDNLSFPLYHPDWGADEELLLLEAIEMFGLGNWSAVAEHMGPNKTPDACQAHWYQIYVESPDYPLPTPAPEMCDVDPARLVQEAKSQGGAPKAAQEVPRRKRGRPPGSHSQHLAAGGADHNGAGQKHPQQGLDSPRGDATDTVADWENNQPSTPSAQQAPKGDAGENADEPGGVESASRGPKRPRLAAATGEGDQHPAEPTRMQVSGRTMHHASVPASAPGADGGENVTGGPGKTVPPGAAVGADGQVKVAADSHSLTGYNPKRNEFDPEFDNDAELLIADMEFHDDDTEEERAAKLHMIDIYNRRLDERERRREFILQHQLLNVRRTQAQEKRRSGLEKQIHASLRVLARYHTPEEQEALAESMMVERRLRQRIHELKECRRLGYRSLSDAESHLEDHRKKMAADHSALSTAARSHILRIPAAPTVRGGDLPLFTPEYGLPSALAPVLSGRSGIPALDAWRLRRGFTLDLRSLPGTQLLSQKERELCARLRVLPPHYLLVKDGLIRDCLENGQLSKSDVREFFRLDGGKAAKIFDLLASCGWINSRSGPSKTLQGPGPSTSSAKGPKRKEENGNKAGSEIEPHSGIKLEDA